MQLAWPLTWWGKTNTSMNGIVGFSYICRNKKEFPLARVGLMTWAAEAVR